MGHLEEAPSTLTPKKSSAMEAFFQPPDYPPSCSRQPGRRSVWPTRFSRWVEHNVSPHRVAGYSIVTLSTKLTGVPPGDVSDRRWKLSPTGPTSYGFGEIRISHEQNFVLPDVPQAKLSSSGEAASAAQLAAGNAGLINDIICCPGGDYCSLANAKSIPVAEAIQRRWTTIDYQHDLGPIDLNISGCMNACGHHHVGHIGILGVDKKGNEFYQISLGGHAGHGSAPASLGQIVGPSVSRADVPEIIQTILSTYIEHREEDETFLGCYQRVGIEPFKERIYGTA